MVGILEETAAVGYACVRMNAGQVPDAPPALLFWGVLFSIVAVLALRRFVPHRPWLAMFLAIFFGPAGHLYLRGAARYVLLMYAAWIGLLVATPLPPALSAFLLTILSAMLMNVRLRQAAAAQSPDTPPHVE
jgi:hypothetical protein